MTNGSTSGARAGGSGSSQSTKRSAPASDASKPPQKKLAPIFGSTSARPQSMYTERMLGRTGTCYFGAWEPAPWSPSRKILALDIDQTVIVPASGAKWPKDKTDFKWWHPNVPRKIKEAHAQGFSIVLFSNQGGIDKHQTMFKQKMPLLGAKLGGNVPFLCFSGFKYDQYRKPAPGMWLEFLKRNGGEGSVDFSESVYVGDAAGRPARSGIIADHSDVDRKFAHNVGLRFMTPEEYFVEHTVDHNWAFTGFDPRSFDHNLPLFEPTNTPLVRAQSSFGPSPPEVVIFVGSPAAGKTTLYERYFQPAGYAHVNQDTLKTRTRCLQAISDHLSAKPPRSCVVDNTSPERQTRKLYLDLIRSNFPDVPVRIVYFTAHKALCQHNSVFRAVYGKSGREILPAPAFDTYFGKLEVPNAEAEGFDSMHTVNFKFEGSEEEQARWLQWLSVYKPPKTHR